jgi:hypothetical protein
VSNAALFRGIKVAVFSYSFFLSAMKYRWVAYALVPTAVSVGILGASMVSAHGFGGFGFGANATPDQIAERQQEMFQNEANMLGISVDAIKAGWAKGESLQQIASDNGITSDQLQAKMKDAAQSRLKSSLQALVDKGVITQAQADARLQFMQTKMQNASTNANHMGHRFHGFGF